MPSQEAGLSLRSAGKGTREQPPSLLQMTEKEPLLAVADKTDKSLLVSDAAVQRCSMSLLCRPSVSLCLNGEEGTLACVQRRGEEALAHYSCALSVSGPSEGVPAEVCAARMLWIRTELSEVAAVPGL